MENQKEPFFKKKSVFSRGKAAVVIGTALLVACAAAYLARSGSARGFLRQGGAIAAESFEDVFGPSTSGIVMSEIDLAPSGTPTVTIAETIGTSSATSSAVAEKNGGCPTSSPRTKKEGTAAAAETVSGSAAGVAAPQASSSEPASVAEGSSADSSAPAADQDCSFPASAPAAISHLVILNEVAWMGSPTSTGVTAEQAANEEWMELKNISDAKVFLDGWRIMDSAGKIKISFGSGDGLAPHGLYLMSRGGNAVEGTSADKAYTGTLSNDGDALAVLDAACGVSDFLDARSGWPGGMNTTKQTLERGAGLGWQTSVPVGGTPGAENSQGMPAVPATASSSEKYAVNVTVAGDGGGKVMLTPNSVTCKTSCTYEYAGGTVVTLAASPGSGANFTGWSGGCSGTSECSFSVVGPVTVLADFHLNIDGMLVASDSVAMADSNNEIGADAGSVLADATNTTDIGSSASDTEETSVATSSGDSSPDTPPVALPAVSHPVIAAVQIAGAATDDDFVKIYNPTQNPVDMSGWKLRKKSSTGTDSSLREFPKGSTIAARGYFTWASSVNGFAQSIGADASSTGTLAANNSAALFDATGAQVDAVAWGTGTGQYVEGAAYPDNPPANDVLQREFANGAVVDTDDNAADFSL